MEDLIKQLSDTDDNNVYPITMQNAVYDTEGNTLDVVIEELKNYVGDGKELVANAITEKGVATEADATFQTMADNIMQISSGEESHLVYRRLEAPYVDLSEKMFHFESAGNDMPSLLGYKIVAFNLYSKSATQMQVYDKAYNKILYRHLSGSSSSSSVTNRYPQPKIATNNYIGRDAKGFYIYHGTAATLQAYVANVVYDTSKYELFPFCGGLGVDTDIEIDEDANYLRIYVKSVSNHEGFTLVYNPFSIIHMDAEKYSKKHPDYTIKGFQVTSYFLKVSFDYDADKTWTTYKSGMYALTGDAYAIATDQYNGSKSGRTLDLEFTDNNYKHYEYTYNLSDVVNGVYLNFCLSGAVDASHRFYNFHIKITYKLLYTESGSSIQQSVIRTITI